MFLNSNTTRIISMKHKTELDPNDIDLDILDSIEEYRRNKEQDDRIHWIDKGTLEYSLQGVESLDN